MMKIDKFEIKCKKCGSNDICLSATPSEYSYGDEIYDVSIICNKCNEEETV
jgi:C4-type Zn-finger protein